MTTAMWCVNAAVSGTYENVNRTRDARSSS